MAVPALTLLISYDAVLRLRKRLNMTKDLYRTADKMLAMLKYRSADVYEMCDVCFDSVKSFDAAAFKSIHDNFSDEWQKACRQTVCELECDAYSAFEGIADYLGMYDLESQTKRLEYTCEQLQKSCQRCESELEKKKKLYLCLGAFAGIIICMIVI